MIIRETFVCFPLTDIRIPQECDKTVCSFEKDHEIYKLFEKKKVRKTIFYVFTTVHRSAIVIFVINILQNAKSKATDHAKVHKGGSFMRLFCKKSISHGESIHQWQR